MSKNKITISYLLIVIGGFLIGKYEGWQSTAGVAFALSGFWLLYFDRNAKS